VAIFSSATSSALVATVGANELLIGFNEPNALTINDINF
jgi:hypothetical protein